MSNPQDHPPTHAEPVKRLVLKINKGPITGSAPSVSASTVLPSTAPINTAHTTQPSASSVHTVATQPSTMSAGQTAVPSHTAVSTPMHTSSTPSTHAPSTHTPSTPSMHTPSAPLSHYTTSAESTALPTNQVTPVTDTQPSPSTVLPLTSHGVAPTPSNVPSTVPHTTPAPVPAKPMTLTVTSGGRTITIKPLAKPGTAPPPTTPTVNTTPAVTPVNPPPVTSPPVARPKFVLKTKLTFKIPRQVYAEEVERLKQSETPKPQLKLKIAFPSRDKEDSTATPSAAARKRKALYDLDDESHDEDAETPRRNKRARVDLDEQSEEHTSERESENDFAAQPKLPMSEVMRHLLTELTARDANAYYRHEITEDVAPNYFEIIKQPMWFDKMAEKLNNNEYPTLVSFQKDFELICKNAMEYNRASTPWHKEARRLLREGKQLIERWTKRLEPNDLALHLDAVNAAALANVTTKRETRDRDRDRDRDRESESESHTTVKKSAHEVGRVSDLVKRKFAGAQSSAPATAHHHPVPEMSSGVMLPPRSSIGTAHMFQATRQIKSPYPTTPVTLTPAPGAQYPPGLHSRAAHATNPASHQYTPLITSRASQQFLSPYVPNFVTFTATTPTTSTHIVAPQIIKLPIHDVSYPASLEHFVHALDTTAQSRVRKFINELRTGPTSAAPHGETAPSSTRAPVLTSSNTLGTSPAELKSALHTAAQLGLDVTALGALLGKLEGEVPVTAPPTLNATVVARKDTLLSANQGALLKLQAMHEERGGDPNLVTPTEQQIVREVSDNLKSFLGESSVPMTE